MPTPNKNKQIIRDSYNALLPYNGKIIGATEILKCKTSVNTLVSRGWAIKTSDPKGTKFPKYLIQLPEDFEEFIQKWEQEWRQNNQKTSWHETNKCMYYSSPWYETWQGE